MEIPALLRPQPWQIWAALALGMHSFSYLFVAYAAFSDLALSREGYEIALAQFRLSILPGRTLLWLTSSDAASVLGSSHIIGADFWRYLLILVGANVAGWLFVLWISRLGLTRLLWLFEASKYYVIARRPPKIGGQLKVVLGKPWIPWCGLFIAALPVLLPWVTYLAVEREALTSKHYYFSIDVSSWLTLPGAVLLTPTSSPASFPSPETVNLEHKRSNSSKSSSNHVDFWIALLLLLVANLLGWTILLWAGFAMLLAARFSEHYSRWRK